MIHIGFAKQALEDGGSEFVTPSPQGSMFSEESVQPSASLPVKSRWGRALRRMNRRRAEIPAKDGSQTADGGREETMRGGTEGTL